MMGMGVSVPRWVLVLALFVGVLLAGAWLPPGQ
jgi:hypothetical protein